MEMYSINRKEFKSLFFQTIIFMAIAIAACFLLLNNGYIILSNFDPGRKLTSPILLGMLALSLFYASYRKKQMKKLSEHTEFEVLVKAFEKIYRLRMRWHMLSCASSCFLCVFTARNIFLYFALFDLLIVFAFYPNQAYFRRELKNDEIILYE